VLVTLVDHSTSSARQLQDNVPVKAVSVASTVISVGVDIMDFLIAELVSVTLLALNPFLTGHWVTVLYLTRFVLCFVLLYCNKLFTKPFLLNME